MIVTNQNFTLLSTHTELIYPARATISVKLLLPSAQITHYEVDRRLTRFSDVFQIPLCTGQTLLCYRCVLHAQYLMNHSAREVHNCH